MRKKDTSPSDVVVWAGVSYEESIVADAIMSEMDAENIKKTVSEKIKDRYRSLHYTVSGDVSELYISWR